MLGDSWRNSILTGSSEGIVLLTDLVGIKAAGRVNDVLTVAKLSPLLLIVLGGFAFVALQPGQFAGNLVPFFTGDVSAFGRRSSSSSGRTQDSNSRRCPRTR